MGLDRDVTVVVWGEFGPAPRIDKGPGGGGRNHWSSASFALLAGGGMRTGQIIGSTGWLSPGSSGQGPQRVRHALPQPWHRPGHNLPGPAGPACDPAQ